MLGTVLLVLGGIVALIVAFVIWRIVATVMGSQARTDEILAEIRSVAEALEAGRDPSREEIARFAAQPRTRNVLLETLQEAGRADLFPGEYATPERMAESDLVFWLCHPNELQAAPDEIEYMGKHSRALEPSRRTGDYYLFRFRVKAPHWAADEGWMAGVAGPHVTGEKPAPAARGTFSDLAPYDSRTPEAHVDTVHEIMVQQGVYAELDQELEASRQ